MTAARAVALLAAASLLVMSAPASAQPVVVKAGDQLEQANAALAEGDFARASQLARPITFAGTVNKQDKAESWRIFGLAEFFLGRKAVAERALLEYLKLSPDAHLDPALIPPEAIVFFEDIRSRNRRLIESQKPRKRRYLFLNLLPPAGQIQNGDFTKAWIIGGVGVAALAANITTFVLLRRWCSDDSTCDGGPGNTGPDRTGEAKVARGINIATGITLFGIVGYGIVDGFLGHRRKNRQDRESRGLVIVPTDGGIAAAAAWRF